MSEEELWKQYCKECKIDINCNHSAWAFGGNPDYLADLVLSGIKRATASGYELYFLEGKKEPLPQVGDLSIILNSRGEAVCIIETTELEVVPYNEVDAEWAYKEGEGDRSLAYWQKVHEEFFEEDYASCGAVFKKDSLILCETFKVVYKPR